MFWICGDVKKNLPNWRRKTHPPSKKHWKQIMSSAEWSLCPQKFTAFSSVDLVLVSSQTLVVTEKFPSPKYSGCWLPCLNRRTGSKFQKVYKDVEYKFEYKMYGLWLMVVLTADTVFVDISWPSRGCYRLTGSILKSKKSADSPSYHHVVAPPTHIGKLWNYMTLYNRETRN